MNALHVIIPGTHSVSFVPISINRAIISSTSVWSFSDSTKASKSFRPSITLRNGFSGGLLPQTYVPERYESCTVWSEVFTDEILIFPFPVVSTTALTSFKLSRAHAQKKRTASNQRSEVFRGFSTTIRREEKGRC